MARARLTKAPLAGAWGLIAAVADPGSFEIWDDDIVSADPLSFVDSKPYAERLTEAARGSVSNESVVTGSALLEERPLGLIAGHFPFLGGSIGVAAGERIARAFERALAGGWPVLALPASGGARMQEGVLALVQMIKLAQSVREFRSAGLPYVVYLTDPTIGAVLASWGSLGHLTFGMPRAVVGFSGPRVVQLTTGAAFPMGVQRPETLKQHGLIDDTFPLQELRSRMSLLLSSLESGSYRRFAGPEIDGDRNGDAWNSVQRSRDATRPGARDLLERCATHVTYLRGDGTGGGDDPCCIAAVARFVGVPSVIVAQDRSASPTGAHMGPAGYRKARRAMGIATELRLPLVTIIDSPGAEMSVEAETGGLSAEIARCLLDMTGLAIPTVSLLLGEGAGGGALALLPADRVLSAKNAWLSSIAPEAASAIVHRSIDRAPDLAAAQRIGSWDLERFGIVDAVIQEPPEPTEGRAEFLDRVGASVRRELNALLDQPPEERLSARSRRYRTVGS
ncbi:MAG: acetyl-CoA carboxyl transferase [Actinobacteria bacterium]|nr:acetyl-CoA carboxyl transferase [Actinomycetota bacterium]